MERKKVKKNKMIDLDWIIKQENELTDKAKSNLGDNYHLLIDLLKLIQGIKSFSVNNEVAHYFETQILKDFHLSALNIIRRHSTDAQSSIRHALESAVLFAYSMEHPYKSEYVIAEDEEQIYDFDDKILNKAQNYIENKYPDISIHIEKYKRGINIMYSHSNIFASQYNTAIIDGRIKALIFDCYYDEHSRELLCILNDTIVLVLDLYKQLYTDYKSFEFEDWFDELYNECVTRLEKLKQDMHLKVSLEDRKKFPALEKEIDRLKEKYNKLEEQNNAPVV